MEVVVKKKASPKRDTKPDPRTRLKPRARELLRRMLKLRDEFGKIDCDTTTLVRELRDHG
jgi:hypothetical protein